MTLLDALLQSKNSTKFESSYEKSSSTSPSSPPLAKGINPGQGKAGRIALDAERNARDKRIGRGYDARQAGAAGWRQGVAANSRFQVIPPAIRATIEAIEADARAKGWPPELLWNAEFWGSPRGLAALLDEGDAIVEVATDYIAILKIEWNILRFRRRAS